MILKAAINRSIFGYGLVLLLAVAGVLAVDWWFSLAPRQEMGLRLALKSHERAAEKVVDIEGLFKRLDGSPSSVNGSWPNFRGRKHDNICEDGLALLDSWPAGGPPLLWEIDLGEGYAGPAVANGCVYVLDYDEQENADALRCFSFDDGREIWRRWYGVKVKRNHGMSRTVPAVTDEFVLTIGPKCQVMCCDALSGEFLWGIDLVSEYDSKVPLWYTGQCPLIDNGVAVIAPGGKALMIGVDCATGDVLWETPNPDGWKMSHSSITPATIAGKKMYIYPYIGGMAGISAEGTDLGRVLWQTSKWDHSVIAPAPLPIGRDRILVTAGYGSGSAIFQIERSGGEFAAREVRKLSKQEFACEQHTPIFYKDHLFTVMPADAGGLKLQAVCATAEGDLVWNSGKENRFGIGPYLIADRKLFILSTDGELTMAEARTDKYLQLAQCKPLEGPDAWGPMALVAGRLLLRDFDRMICLDLREER